MSGGNSALLTRSPEEAEALCSEAIGLLREIDDKWSLAWGLNALGHAALQLDHLEVARASFEECIAVARNIGNPGAMIACLLGAAIVAIRLFQKQSMGNGKEVTPSLVNAVRLLSAIPSLNQNLHTFFWLGWWRNVYEQTTSQAKALTPDEIWKQAFAEGEMLSMQQAVTLALEELQVH
jgi:hypothetical protein